MEIITSLDNKKIKNLSKLLLKKYRDIENKFLIEGEHLVEEAIKANVLLEVIKCDDFNKEYGVPTTIVTYDVIRKLSNTQNPQKVFGVCKKLSSSVIGKNVVILDDIQDPGNLGTIIRSCVAFGVHSIVLSNNSVDLYNDKVLRSSEGMIFYINIIRDNVLQVINKLHEDGYVVYGTKVDGGKNLKMVSVPSKYAIVMGNEGAGVSSEVLHECDEYLYIPMSSKCESLNVGVATSIILYELGDK